MKKKRKRKGQGDFQKIWPDPYRNLSRRRRHNQRRYWGDNQCFEGHGQTNCKWFEDPGAKSGFCAARADRLHRELLIQNRWTSLRVSRRTHLAFDFGGGRLSR